MKRREFLKDLAVGSLMLNIGPNLIAQGNSYPDLAVIEGESPSLITKEAIKTIGGMHRFIAKGDKVVVKPNIGWDRTPEQAACTNPDVVKTLVELCFDAGARMSKSWTIPAIRPGEPMFAQESRKPQKPQEPKFPFPTNTN
jgi:hypothetical protein